MAEYCNTLQSKEKRNRENKACLNERAILCLFDHEFLKNFYLLRLTGSVSSDSGIFGCSEVVFSKHCDGRPYFALLAYT